MNVWEKLTIKIERNTMKKPLGIKNIGIIIILVAVVGFYGS